MKGDEIVFAPIAAEWQHTKRHLDLSALSLSEVITESLIAQFVILEGLPHRRHLFIEKADAIGFIANLKLRIRDARKDGVSRLTSQDQLYDLQISIDGTQCSLCDFAQRPRPEVQVDSRKFMKSIDECAAGVYETMLLLFPELGSRKDLDQLRKLLVADRRTQDGHSK